MIPYLTFSVDIELMGKVFGVLRFAQVVDHILFNFINRLDLAQEVYKCWYVH